MARESLFARKCTKSAAFSPSFCSKISGSLDFVAPTLAQWPTMELSCVTLAGKLSIRPLEKAIAQVKPESSCKSLSPKQAALFSNQAPL